MSLSAESRAILPAELATCMQGCVWRAVCGAGRSTGGAHGSSAPEGGRQARGLPEACRGALENGLCFYTEGLISPAAGRTQGVGIWAVLRGQTAETEIM